MRARSSFVSGSFTVAALAVTGLALSPACGSTDEVADPEPTQTEPEVAEAPAPEEEEPEAIVYPDTRTVDQKDDYHGTEIADPYRWLEDPDSTPTAEWVKAENEVTFGFLEKIPVRDELKTRLTELWNYPRYSPPFREGKTWFHFKNDGLQNQAVLYALESVDAEPRLLLDPNALSEDGTVALGGQAFTKDGTLMAYALSEGGSDWRTWYVMNTQTGEKLSDKVEWSKFSGASWTRDNKGFFYSRYPEPKEGDALEAANYFHKVYFHKVGTPQSEDQLIFEDKENKERGFEAFVTDDGRYLIIHVWEGTDRRNRLYFKDLKNKRAKVVKLLDAFDAGYAFIGNVGAKFFIRTDLDAPKGRVIEIDTKRADKKRWKTVIAEGEDKLEGCSMLGGGLLCNWLHNAHDKITLHDLKGKQTREIELPTIGSVGGFRGEPDDTEVFYSFTSFNYPSTIFHLDLKTGESKLWRKPEVKFTPEDYVVEQVWVESKDTTKIPMFVVHKKGIEKNGENPTYLYGYGGFNVNLTPSFSVALVAWLERGGVYAMPTLRGGGEFGEAWHEAGMLEKKQNVFDDFASAAQWLKDNGYTKTEKLAIGGGSNGGLLVGATITQNPDLVGAAICRVGVLDMLRYHKFTIGHAWVNEYGSSDDAEQFKFLIEYSPLHNTEPGTHYPATLITTADHDDRVVPAHSFKFAAQLQKDHAGPQPVLIRIETKAGHGAGKPTSKLIEEYADTWAFLLQTLGELDDAKKPGTAQNEGGAKTEGASRP